MENECLHISVEAAPGYEPPQPVRAALEQLAEAVNAMAQEHPDAEVDGFVMGKPGAGSLLDMSPRQPSGPISAGPPVLQTFCLGTYTYDAGDLGDMTCNWVFWD